MPLVKYVHDRHHFHCAAVAVFRVHVVLYGDEPNTERGEYIVNILSDLDIVPAETGKVFYDNRIDHARLGIVQQSLHFGALKGSARNAVVYLFVVSFKAMLFGILA